MTKSKKALIRALCAAALAVLLFVLSDFAAVRLIKGPETQSGGMIDLSEGSYVTINVDMILGYFAEEYSDSDEVTALYAVVPNNGRFYAVILTERYFDSAEQINTETLEYINGERAEINDYILVTGTAEELGETAAGLFYDWFGENMDSLAEAGLTDGEVEDYADYISVIALRADETGRVSTVRAWVLTALCWLLLMYAVIVLLRLSRGKYAPQPEPEEAAPPSEDAPPEGLSGEPGPAAAEPAKAEGNEAPELGEGTENET